MVANYDNLINKTTCMAIVSIIAQMWRSIELLIEFLTKTMID